MIILPPLQLIIDFIDKGFMRNVLDVMGEQAGVSGNTIRNTIKGKTRPSKSTLEKIGVAFLSKMPFINKSKYSIRKLHRMNDWRYFLEGMRASGFSPDEIPKTQALLDKICSLDEALLKDYQDKAKLIAHVTEFVPKFIEPNVLGELQSSMSHIELRRVFWVSSAKAVLLVVSCYDAELMSSSGRKLPESFFRIVMSTDPRKSWVEVCRGLVGAESNHELGRIYANHSKELMDEENARAHINRIQRGTHKVSQDSLDVLSKACKDDVDRDILYISLIVSELSRFLIEMIRVANSIGHINTYTPDHLVDTYNDYLSSWCEEFGIRDGCEEKKSDG
jgi:hypothetical protein